MKKSLISTIAAVVLVFAATSSNAQVAEQGFIPAHADTKCQWINGYYRKDGTWVQGHWRGC